MLNQTLPSRSERPALHWNPETTLRAEAASVQQVAGPCAWRISALDLQAALIGGLDRLSHGVALLDVAGCTHYANATACTLFGRLGWEATTPGRPSVPADWTPALRKVCVDGRRELLRINAPQARAVVVLTPLLTTGTGMAFAVFGRDELCGAVELQLFALHFQLTHAETAVLRHLTRGLSAAAIALEHGVARTTVVTQIAAIRSKTHCTSVRSLLETLARMPPIHPLQPVAKTP